VKRLAVLAALAALLVAGCGGSSRPKGPPALLFVSTRDGDYAIFGADADGKHAHRLSKEKGDPSTPEGLFFEGEPAWSPDGTKIAFVSRRDGKSHVYVMKADGTNVRRVTDSDQDDNRPTWSPDGRRLVFSREGALVEMPAGGGPVRRVVRAPGQADDPVWSPDGKWIAYDYRAPGSSIREVYVARANGTGIRQVTHLGQVSGRPVWSPDGKRLAFQSNVYESHFEVYTVRLDGEDVKRVTISDIDTIEPDWSRDGAIAFSRDGAIWSTLGGKEAKLTSSKDNDSAPAWRPVRQQ
jgi:Tol biopolymer transport system component